MSTHEALDNTLPNFEFEYELFSSDNYNQPCEAFFYEYVAAAGNFTHCILLRAKPFRICTKCFEHYAIMKSLYNDLTTDPKLHNCMIKYLKSDRVQIIPTVEKNIDSLWQTSSCDSCIKNLKVDEKTKEVVYIIPEAVHKFLTLYTNISDCLMGNLSLNIDTGVQGKKNNISTLCKLCDIKYQELNDHYNSMSNSANGDVCMDVVDMMNYTRVTWSVDLNCSHRSGDAASVVTITLIVAISPLFFYLPLRYTSKEKIKTVLKQKRYEGFVSSASASFAAQEGSSASATSLPAIGS
ncbi:hypothetical protein RRG08_002805 [Elysia crispata]|uniref:Osteopetrosis-associated transmembrane protein 1 n=1 Tax=Elysia crispata TaxID=231223 RepID=A0AAE0XUC8_9GAST|nr:hypothetical protein RRG08_002805 [Elysia crispata]